MSRLIAALIAACFAFGVVPSYAQTSAPSDTQKMDKSQKKAAKKAKKDQKRAEKQAKKDANKAKKNEKKAQKDAAK